MASTISAGTTSGTAIAVAGDTTGNLAFQTNGTTTAMTIDTSQNVGIGTSSPFNPVGSTMTSLTINGSEYGTLYFQANAGAVRGTLFSTTADNTVRLTALTNHPLVFGTNDTERMRISSDGDLLVGMSSMNPASNGVYINFSTPNNSHLVTANTRADGSGFTFLCNRQGSDGTLIEFRQADITEGSISVSGSTISYNGGHLSRWSQLPDGSKDDTILKGTVLSNLDDMCVWEKDGVVADNEQLNKMKVSDVEGDTNVAGVFVNWTRDEDYNSDDMNIAMTGDMIIRVAQGVTVARGDLLMSAGDGTAKPQGDDIVRSKTIAKVTSTHVTCTYEDGSYCVPCVLMAC